MRGSTTVELTEKEQKVLSELIYLLFENEEVFRKICDKMTVRETVLYKSKKRKMEMLKLN